MTQESYEVLYTKDINKKKKLFHDGIIIINNKNNLQTLLLFDKEKKEITKRNLIKEQINEIKKNNEIIIGQYLIQIEKEYNKSKEEERKEKEERKQQEQQEQDEEQEQQEEELEEKQEKRRKVLGINNKGISRSLGNRMNTTSVINTPLPMSREIDPSLLRVMRAHQIQGFNFIMNCFTSPPIITGREEDEDDEDNDEDCFQNDKNNSNQDSDSEMRRGAILADDMGLGKTLTAISILSSCVKGGRAKGLIICPSSLIDNWEKEIRKWMGVKLKPLCLRSGPQAAGVVNTFRVGHPNMTPVLILSYEMFRKHAAVINTTPLLDIIICDEGHRLKNVTGTKTMAALRSCKATKRLVLTGTPIQNHLSELYAILQFVCPDTSQIGLGSLRSFKYLIGDPIDRYNRAQAAMIDTQTPVHPALIETAKVAKEKLNIILQRVMIRRSRDEVLRALLPPRKEYLIMCQLSNKQETIYQQVADVMKNEWDKDVNRDTSSYLLPGLQKLRQICNNSTEDLVFDTKKSSDNSYDDDYDDNDDVNEGFDYGESVKEVTSSIKKRRVSSSSSLISGINSTSSKLKSNLVSSLPRKQVRSTQISTNININGNSNVIDLEGSSKLKILDTMITHLHDRRTNNPQRNDGKIVIVSNFTSMLDTVETLANYRGWPTLRLDGTVLSDKRQSLVDRFNRSNDPSLIFLLSSKAGGVGLNLIGGNRLVMVDCDWNPAIDAQAMARVWREGQTRPVYVYRLITSNRIEDAIYQRQKLKEGLHTVISDVEKNHSLKKDKPVEKKIPKEETLDVIEDTDSDFEEDNDNDNNNNNDDDDNTKEGEEEKSDEEAEANKISPWLADIWSLVWPTDNINPENTIQNETTSTQSLGDDLLEIVANTCRQEIKKVIPVD